MKSLFLLVFCLASATMCPALVYERFEQDGKVGIRTDQGQVILPASFDALGWSDGSFSLIGQITGYRQGQRWGLLNLKKEFITKADFLSLTWSGGDRVRVSREVSAIATKYGLINLKGELAIPLVYDAIEIHDLRAIVMRKEGLRYLVGLVDLNDRSILPLMYQRITPLGSLRYAVVDFNGKTALCSEEGKWITGFDIDSLSAFRFNLAVIYRNLQRGVIDREGNIRAEPAYRDVRILENGNVQVRRSDEWKIIDIHQTELHRLSADKIEPLTANRYKVTHSGKLGIVDSLFREILPIAYDFIGPVNHEKLVVGQAGKYGLMRTNRSLALPIAFDSVILEGHLVRVQSRENGKPVWHLYDTVGVRKTTTSFDQLDPYNGHFFPAFRGGFAGAIDRTGAEQIACVYDSLLDFDETRCAVKFKGLYGIITQQDAWKLLPQPNPIKLVPRELHLEITGSLKMVKDDSSKIIYFTDNPLSVMHDHFLEVLPDGTEKEINFCGQIIARRPPEIAHEIATSRESEGMILVRRDGKYGFVDSRGRLRIANRYEDAGDFHEGLAPVRLLGKWGFIDPSDQIVIQPVYDHPAEFEHGLAVVSRAGKTGLIDRHGNVLLELRYDAVHRIDAENFYLVANGHMGLADHHGKVLLEPRFDSLEPAGAHHVIVGQGGRFGLLTRDGLSVFPVQYEHLEFLPLTQTFFAWESFGWETIEVK
ncbi:MAG: WG repeat-containing protein [Cyclobacteriaceae bacterium]|nr:WG repeat-containing protein [Cyclobacteriaceae bacterium]